MGVIAAFMVPHPPLIVPEVGGGEEKKIQNTINAYQEVACEIGALQPETIILTSPHQVMYADYFHISPGDKARGDFGRYRAKQVGIQVSYDTGLADRLCQEAARRHLAAGTAGEREKGLDHGTMVPLYFINRYWTGYRLVRIGLSGMPLLEHYRFGQCIKEAVESLGRRAVFLASGDLSHKLREDGPYGYRKEGPEYDSRVMEAMGIGDFGKLLEFSEDFCDKAAECGHRSFVIMAGALDQTEVKARRLSYEGPFGVGYGICAYQAGGEDARRNFKAQFEEKERVRLQKQRGQEDAYVRLARKAIETYVRTGQEIQVPKGLPAEMGSQQAGAFVSIKEDGRLRGCIGTIRPVCPSLAEEVIQNAISACSRDPRFPPITEDELDKLSVSVDVLGDTQEIESLGQLDVKRYGVVVSKGYKRGLLLPNLEGVDTVEEQVAIARQKAGVGPEEKVRLERFEVVRHY